MSDYLFRGRLEDIDPDVFQLTRLEDERQISKIILIPSESQAPLAVRQAMGSTFQNIYAEGYPDEESRTFTESEILDYEGRLAYYRRYSDPRYYKGTEYADFAESLARRRAAELFAANGVAANQIFANVQALSGAPANNAVYHALMEPGETVLGMNLLHGGHLTHGSSVNRSGKYYKAVHYTVDPETEQINYDQIMSLAQQHKPKMIISGFSSYPWSVDWEKMQAIARSVGAYLLADIAHVAGLVAGGVYPSPIGYADVITFTTHKSLCGPRGAVILTTNGSLAKKIDRAVFPGEQGGPHVNIFAAIAVALKLASTDQFRALQKQIVANCLVFTNRLKDIGFRIPYGGTNTHLMNLDVTSVVGPDGTTLSGDQAARLLDLAGIVVNRNTIPGDRSSADPSGLRMGTPWVTQRGFREPQMIELADLIGDLLLAAVPYRLQVRTGEARRSKIDFKQFELTKIKVRELALNAGSDLERVEVGYPHYYYVDGEPGDAQFGTGLKSFDPGGESGLEWTSYQVTGERSRAFLNAALAGDIDTLQSGERRFSQVNLPDRAIDSWVYCSNSREFELSLPADQAALAAAWIRDLSDGFVGFGDDVFRKLPGPVIVRKIKTAAQIPARPDEIANHKPFFIGVANDRSVEPALPEFIWVDQESELRRTPIYETHKRLGAKIIPFAGWEMPVWYSSVVEEHQAVRQAAGLFDVAHMGVYQATGADAANFLDSVVGNDVGGLKPGESLYTHLLDADANVIDDLLIYRRGAEKFLIVVNASNDDKNWTWLNRVKDGTVLVDRARPWAKVFGSAAQLVNLRDPAAGDEMRVDLALQGPRSRDILLALGVDQETRQRIMALKRTELCDAIVGGFDLIVSRTGYTGERMAFELFVHPGRANEFFNLILETGSQFGCKPIGLAARDSLRTEAGLPLYGHEMGVGSGISGALDLGVGEAGFGSYVKIYKPWFIGRQAYLAREANRQGGVVRFRFNDKGVRMAHNGDPAIDRRGRTTGWVTSCAVDKDGYLTGQAYVEIKNAEQAGQIYIYQSASDKPGVVPAALKTGDKVVLPSGATIISRFPKP